MSIAHKQAPCKPDVHLILIAYRCQSAAERIRARLAEEFEHGTVELRRRIPHACEGFWELREAYVKAVLASPDSFILKCGGLNATDDLRPCQCDGCRQVWPVARMERRGDLCFCMECEGEGR